LSRIYSESQKTGVDFTSVDYPSAYENLDLSGTKDTPDADERTFRSKTVYNSNKHSLEFIDTDGEEILKMTHFSGSFKEFTNYANIELATNNDQKMVIGDQFLTVKKNQSIFVAKARELIVEGDLYQTVGNVKIPQIQNIITILKNIHNYKQLFDTKRTPHIGRGTSSLQTMVGTQGVCPTCGGLGYTPNSDLLVQYYSTGTIDPNWNGLACEDVTNPNWVPLFTDAASSILSSTLNEIAGNIGFYLGSRCDSCSRNRDGFSTGNSPSTQDGNWNTETLKTQVAELIKNETEALYEEEKQLGEGDKIIKITKNKVENIGLVMNDMDPYRIDPIGKVAFNGVYTATEGSYPTYKASQLIEYVDVDDVPGGDYNLTVTNKYKLLVGAKGINIKTFGPLDMYAPIINVTGEQVNIMSRGETVIDGGERTFIRGKQIILAPNDTQSTVVSSADGSVYIKQPQGTSVSVSGNFGVNGNTILNGGALVEGELGITHVSAPFEWHLTEPAAPIKTTGSIAYCLSGGESSHVHYIMPIHQKNT